MDYLRDPQAIYAQSFATIRAECDLSRFPADAHDVVIRMVHACGMPEILPDIVITPDYPAASKRAFLAKAPIFVDAEMIRHGIVTKGAEIICTLNDPRAREHGIASGTTRSAAAVDLWLDRLPGSIACIGNAPTALFRLLEAMQETGRKPAVIVGLPVGFVGAAESKQALEQHANGVPFLTLRGRRGGTAMAAAALNALIRGLT